MDLIAYKRLHDRERRPHAKSLEAHGRTQSGHVSPAVRLTARLVSGRKHFALLHYK